MKKLIWIAALLIMPFLSNAQEHDWAFGFYSDLRLEDANYDASFGVQGKYDFTNRQSVQAQFHGRGDMLAVGADYLVQFLDKEKSNFNVFAGVGVGQEFFTYDYAFEGNTEAPTQVKENFTKANGQIGLSYYFPVVDLSIYAGYKYKYQFKNEVSEPNFVMLGLRYHIW